MIQVTFDTGIHIAEIAALLGGAKWILRAGLAVRDGLKELKEATADIRGDVDDHEDRLRFIEGKPMRRRRDQQQVEVT